MRRPCAVVFDLDGTLVDSYPEIAATFERAVSACGLPVLGPLPRSAIGPPLGALLASVLPGATPEQLERVRETFILHYDRSDFAATKLFPGIAELLLLLAARGVPALVATSKRDRPTRRLIDRLALGPFAEVTCVDTLSRPRSKSEMVADLVTTHGLDPRSTWMVGDTDSDVRAGHAQGLFSVAVAWGYGTAASLRDAHPDLLAEDPVELLGLVRQRLDLVG